MGIQRENGYSASVEAFLAVGDLLIRVARTSRDFLTLSQPCEFPPGTEGELVVSVDGHREARGITLNEGVAQGQRVVPYRVTVPF
jgi:hypothetical protein